MLTLRDLKAEITEIEALPECEQFDALIAYLATKHTRQNLLATFVLMKLGGQAITRLLHEAFTPERTPQHRVRILDVVERINEPLTYEQWMMLTSSAPLYSATVQRKIAQLRIRLSPMDRAIERIRRVS